MLSKKNLGYISFREASPVASRESGNVLFIILIAVALFAALGYAITQSQRGSGKDASSEKYSVRASRIIQYSTSVRAAVQRMNIGGVAPADLNFWYDSGLPSAVFSKAGGNIILDKPGFTTGEAFAGDSYSFLVISDNKALKNVGSSAPDIVMTAFMNFNNEGRSLCSAINKTLGMDTIPGSTSGPDWYNAADGMSAGCVQNWSSFYIFYIALIER